MRQPRIIVAALLLISPFAANADTVSFDLDWAPTCEIPNGGMTVVPPPNLENTDNGCEDSVATATGMISIDDEVLILPGENSWPLMTFVTDFMLIVGKTSSGAGDGTFVLSDFDEVFLGLGSLVDFSQDLVGQTGLIDFNIFASGSVPNGVARNVFMAADGTYFELTSFRPKSTSVPEPSTLALLGLGLAGMSLRRRKEV